jgi:hypothetical protein
VSEAQLQRKQPLVVVPQVGDLLTTGEQAVTTLRGGPYDGAPVVEVDWFTEAIFPHSLVIAKDGSLTLPRAVTIETDDSIYRYELADEEYWVSFGPRPEDGDVDTRYFYQYAGKTAIPQTS